ncbi:2-isopropylmalate synthase [Rugamonas aquatica]|uniref:2-isopropylmalate synthase n=1 Tax=Rugamonas aquatica TaxID=2743357 RepID=A0A6A7N5H5_9BURK|nr:2-isopropylmalate synthase [Rugamonas aquatica]MQA40375.1 2-isopropylmalate synthase [Rugamonas aquatica]
MQKIRIVDATLREGNQAPAVRFSVEQACHIATLLEAVGVDMIECGHALAGEEERRRIRALRGLGLATPLLSHARAQRADIDAAADSGAQWVGIFCGINRVSRLTRLGGRPAASVMEMVRRSVAYAKSRGLGVRYTVEDASRTPDELVIRVLRAAIDEGADRICYADTLGAMTPSVFGAKVAALRAALPGVDLEVHIHDDRGFAMANAWAALEAGANWISTSVNGIGERCGITDLALLLANLDLEGYQPLRQPQALQHLSAFVAAATRSAPDHRRPVVGQNAFTHTARLHTQAMQRSPLSYAVFDAQRCGRAVQLAPPPTPRTIDRLVVSPQVISATELKYHRAGPGSRYVMVDNRFVDDARQYCIVRDIPPQHTPAAAHVDPHRHGCDSLFLFIGKEDGLTGLSVEVLLDGEIRVLHSPASMLIPAGAEHSYRVLGGSGLYINHVLAGDYNASLLEMPDRAPQDAVAVADTSSITLLRQFLADLSGVRGDSLGMDADLIEGGVIDSIGMLELFVFIETHTRRPLPDSGLNTEYLRTIRSIADTFFTGPAGVQPNAAQAATAHCAAD